MSLLDPGTVAIWLQLLHSNSAGWLHISCTGNWTGRCFRPAQLREAVEYVAALDLTEPVGIYLRVTTLKTPPEIGGRGGDKHTSTLPGLWADLDILGPGHAENNLPPDEEAARRIVATAGLPQPTIWVHSGGGLYPWWLLDKPHLIDSDDDLADIAALSRTWQHALTQSATTLGYTYGPVPDLARVLRIPGTVNRKTSEPRPVRLLYHIAQRFSLGALYAAAATIDDQEIARTPAAPARAPLPDDANLAPGDDFEARTDWADILTPHGWRLLRQHGATRYWQRPGKTGPEASATTGHDPVRDRLYVFSTSTAFTTRCSYTKFAAYCVLHHGGDNPHAFTQGAGALAAAGFGARAQARLRARDDLAALGGVDDAPAGAGGPGPESGQAAGIDADDGGAEREGGAGAALGIVAGAAGPEVHRGQARFADRFVARYRGQFLYVHQVAWHRFDGTRWAPCLDGAPVRAMKDLIREAYSELGDLDREQRKILYADIQKCSSQFGIAGALMLAGADEALALAPDRLDTGAQLFNTCSGTVELDSGLTRAPDPDDWISKITGAPLDVHARADEWETFLARVLPHEAVRDFVARLMGYAMLGTVREHVLPIFTGTGANGKDVFRATLMAAFGDYSYEVDPELLLATSHQRHGAFRMQLRGRRLVFCSETGRDHRLDESTMKRLTGGGRIEANYMRQNPISFEPSHTLVMITNFLPSVSDDDQAAWRRLLVVPFDVTIPEHERDSELPERLRAPEILGGVLAWAYRGFLQYRQIGLDPPEEVQRRTQEYRGESDVLGRFLEDQIAFGATYTVSAKDLYMRYEWWCRENGEHPESKQMFGRRMARRGLKSEKSTYGLNFYRGLGLRGQVDDHEAVD